MTSRLALLAITTATVAGHAQSPPPAGFSFEVASIKRNVSSNPGFIRVEEGSRFNAVSASMALIIRQAYGLQLFQVVNLPDWVNSERYDIQAKAPDGVEVFPNMAPLLRSLLKERFGFAAHTEQRQLPTYDLLHARGDRQLGPKVSQAALDCGARNTGAPPPKGPSGEELCLLTQGPGKIIVRGYSMARFAQLLMSQLQRPVVDQTGLTGGWNLELTYTPDQPAVLNGVTVTSDPDAPSLFTAVQEQLELKLESSRGPVDVLVIDRISRPTED